MTILEFKNLEKTKKIISELGQPVKPYITKSDVKIKDDPDYGDYSFLFKDEFGNDIKCCFIKIGINSFEVEFMVNGSSTQSQKSTVSHFLKILSSVIVVINVFIEEFDPSTLLINGLDKIDSTEGLKSSIYITYAKNLIDSDKYKVGAQPSGFAIQKIQSELEEFYNKIKK